MKIISIDPGPIRSAWLVYDGTRPVEFGLDPNPEVISRLPSFAVFCDLLVIEQIRSYGMSVGAEVFDTCVWSGRFCQAFDPERTVWLPRQKVKLALCYDSRAKDANIRQALIDRFGGKDAAIGTKRNRGPLHGISKDVWSALAVAVAWWEGCPNLDAVADAHARAVVDALAKDGLWEQMAEEKQKR